MAKKTKTFWVYLSTDGSYITIQNKVWSDVQDFFKPIQHFKGFTSLKEAEEFIAKDGFNESEAYNFVECMKEDVSVPEGIQAVIYVDGSVQKKPNSDDYMQGSYGLIMFSADGVHCEWNHIWDPNNQNTDSFVVRGASGFTNRGSVFENRMYYNTTSRTFEPLENNPNPELYYEITKRSDNGNYGFVHTGQSAAGEFLGASRAIELCIEKGYTENVLILYDAEEIQQAFAAANTGTTDSNASNYFRNIVKNSSIKNLMMKSEYAKVYSHDKADYYIDHPDQMTCYFGLCSYFYNDIVDVLAKLQLKAQPMLTKKDNRVLAETLKLQGSYEALNAERNSVYKYGREKTLPFASNLVTEILKVDTPVKRYFNL